MSLLFSILVFSFGGFLIATACSYLFVLNLFKERSQIIKRLIQTVQGQLLENLHLDKQINNLADEKLERLVSNFKEKVPMVGMFLAGDLELTLKQIAKDEFLSMVPEIEKDIVSHVQQTTFYQNIENQLLKADFTNLFSVFLRLLLPSLILGAILGASFGATLFIFFRPN